MDEVVGGQPSFDVFDFFGDPVVLIGAVFCSAAVVDPTVLESDGNLLTNYGNIRLELLSERCKSQNGFFLRE